MINHINCPACKGTGGFIEMDEFYPCEACDREGSFTQEEYARRFNELMEKRTPAYWDRKACEEWEIAV